MTSFYKSLPDETLTTIALSTSKVKSMQYALAVLATNPGRLQE